jgi:hypothetical protein
MMNRNFMLFSALVAVPVSAMVCNEKLLFFFTLFPLVALAGRKWKYCRRFLVLSTAPAVVLAWASLTGNSLSILRSVRWICAVASGTYFASVLGSAGIASVLGSSGSFSFFRRLSRLMLLAGSTASKAGECWLNNSRLPLVPRILRSASDSVKLADYTVSEPQDSGHLALPVAVVSWIFLLVSVSGIADGLVK